MAPLPSPSWDKLTHRRASACSLTHRNVKTFAGAALEARPKPAPQLPTELPPSLKNNVAILEAPNAEHGKTMCYVLGMSHVSKASCEQVRELIELVQPEIVAVELCRQRVPFLVDAEAPLDPTPLWHSRKVTLVGLPTDDFWPKEEQLQALLRCKVGRPISTKDIEDDVFSLLRTGLFRFARPLCQGPGPKDAPLFTPAEAAGGSPTNKLSLVKPLGSVNFSVQERLLPPITQLTVRLDSSLRNAGVPQEALNAICEAAVSASQAAAAAAVAEEAATLEAEKADTDKKKKEPEEVAAAEKVRVEAREKGVNGLPHYLKAKAEFAALFDESKAPAGVQVTFTGVEFGKTEAVIRAARPTDPTFLSGFEGSAVDGEGEGITPFRPNRPMFKVSDKMFVPTDIIERLRQQQREVEGRAAEAKAAGDSTPAVAASNVPCRTEFRSWTEEEVEKSETPEVPEQVVADFVAQYLTGTYSKYQSVAARRVGIAPGAAWRAAFDAAVDVGAQQLLLVDRPITVTERKFADAVFADVGARVAGVLGLIAAGVYSTTSAFDALPVPYLGIAAAAAASAALMWPIVGPILEVSKFSSMKAAEIEDAVAMKTPIQEGDLSKPVKVYGEDALLDWPGAMQYVIRERDTYLAKTLAAAATGTTGMAPAFVLAENSAGAAGNGAASPSRSDKIERVWRYMAPDGEAVPAMAAPKGAGDGAYQPLKNPRAIVAVVGTAHVHGMCAEWQRALEDTNVAPLLNV